MADLDIRSTEDLIRGFRRVMDICPRLTGRADELRQTNEEVHP